MYCVLGKTTGLVLHQKLVYWSGISRGKKGSKYFGVWLWKRGYSTFGGKKCRCLEKDANFVPIMPATL